MKKSSKSRRSINSRTPTLAKPKKPHSGFPLFPHASGRWAKKIRQRTHFFGRWGNKSGRQIVPAKDVDATAAEALEEFNRQWPYLRDGRTPPPKDAGDGCTIAKLCDSFLNAKRNRLETGELSLHSFAKYYETCQLLVEHFGKHRPVDDLRPDDFESFRSALGKGCGIVTLKSKINRCRVVLKYASDSRLVEHPVQYGRAFDRPSERTLRAARNAAGERMFEAAEIRRILDELDDEPAMRAMVLLGINCGFGNTDCSSLPRSAVDLDGGWIEFPRPKTAVRRRVPLWPETIEAMRQALAVRPKPKDPGDAGLCFITSRGTRFVRVQESNRTKGRHVTVNALGCRFEGLLHRLKINGRRGLGFYTFRHVVETVAGECRDQIAVNAVMGHVDRSMAAAYRERISDDRLRAVVETVRAWLFAK